jgi:small conductance mechanosensitive channel
MEQIIIKLQEWIAFYGLKVIAAAAILVIGRFIAMGVRAFVKRLLQRIKVDETLVSFVTSLSYVAMMTFVIIAAVGQLGVQTTSFVAVIGAAGLAVGLALQGSLANFAAGVLMIIFKPFKVGDYIDAGGTSGEVETVGIFTTELISPDNKKVIIPNAKVTADNIVNYTAKDRRRVDILARVGYGENLDKVRNILVDILADDRRVLKDPVPTVGVLELGESSVNLAVRAWVRTSDYWDVFFAVQEMIKTRFGAEGIGVPFPHRGVALYKTE